MSTPTMSGDKYEPRSVDAMFSQILTKLETISERQEELEKRTSKLEYAWAKAIGVCAAVLCISEVAIAYFKH